MKTTDEIYLALTIIQGYSEMLQQTLYGPLTPKQGDSVQRILHRVVEARTLLESDSDEFDLLAFRQALQVFRGYTEVLENSALLEHGQQNIIERLHSNVDRLETALERSCEGTLESLRIMLDQQMRNEDASHQAMNRAIDDVLQQYSWVAMKVDESLAAQMNADHPDVVTLQECRSMLKDANKQLGHLSYNLFPIGRFSDQTLRGTIELAVSQFYRQANSPVMFDIAVRALEIPDEDIRLCIYHIITGAFKYMRRLDGAYNVLITSSTHSYLLELSIDADAPEHELDHPSFRQLLQAGVFDLAQLYERARIHGGTLDMVSNGRGRVMIKLVLPLPSV